jgi:hypothetical protein
MSEPRTVTRLQILEKPGTFRDHAKEHSEMSKDAIAYTMHCDFSPIEGEGYDVTLVPFRNWEYSLGWLHPKYLTVPNPVFFEADFQVTQHSDFPFNDVRWPLMSTRMIEVLCHVGPFPHRLMPVRLLDRRAEGPARYLPDKSLRPEVTDDRFAAVQLTEHVDITDWERSVFKQTRLGAMTLYSFSKIVLREPPGGLLPIFRIPENENLLIVSAEARRALEAANIRGIKFNPLPGEGEVAIAS